MINTILLDIASDPETLEEFEVPLLIIIAIIITFFTALNLIIKVQKKNKDLITAQKEAERKAEKDTKIEAVKRTESNGGK